MSVIHPKVKAAFWAALAVAFLNVVNAVTADYSGAWVPLLSAVAPVIAGYMKSAASHEALSIPHDTVVVDPALDGDDSVVGP